MLSVAIDQQISSARDLFLLPEVGLHDDASGGEKIVTSSSLSDHKAQDYSLIGLFDEVLANAEGEEVSIGDIANTFRQQAYGPLLLIPSLLALIPIIGAIPGMSIVTATLILLICAQMIAGWKHPWLPRRLRNFSVKQRRLERAIDSLRPSLAALDRWTRPRMTALSERPLYLVIPSIGIMLALLMYPLALVPWGVTLPSLALTILSVGLTIRDGYVLMAGYAVTAISVLSAFWIW